MTVSVIEHSGRQRLATLRLLLRLVLVVWAFAAPVTLTIIGSSRSFALEKTTPRNLAGAFGRSAAGPEAFALPIRGLGATLLERFFEGQRLFNTAWVAAPSREVATDGLGPIFNRVGCGRCHEGNGRGRPPAGPDEALTSSVLRLGIPESAGAARPDPVYGRQLQSRSIPGVKPEGYGKVRWRYFQGAYADGTRYELRAPVLSVRDLTFGALHPGTRLSMRIASPVFGVGALALVPEKAIRALADPEDRDSDGISGRVASVRAGQGAPRRLGRFGWKAARATIQSQTASAFSQDMGLTSRLFPERVCANTTRGKGLSCQSAPQGGKPEIRPAILRDIVFYLSRLAVPERRRTGNSDIQRGDRLFRSIGCAACHRPSMPARRPQGNATMTIHPFTDLLLHDMGPGLSDGLPEAAARAGEWRTPPLWGIGRTARVNGHRFYLHDGRARNLAEAILWHGGEGEAAKERFRGMTKADRKALLAFLGSL